MDRVWGSIFCFKARGTISRLALSRWGEICHASPWMLIPTCSALPSQSANALTYDELQGLTYLQVKGTGVANTCSVIQGGSSDLKVRHRSTAIFRRIQRSGYKGERRVITIMIIIIRFAPLYRS